MDHESSQKQTHFAAQPIARDISHAAATSDKGPVLLLRLLVISALVLGPRLPCSTGWAMVVIVNDVRRSHAHGHA